MLLDIGAADLADDLVEVQQNGDPQLVDVLDNDTFMAGYQGERQITSVSFGSEGGRIEIADNGRSIRYAPPADFSGTETFVYYVDNQFSANVTVTVLSLLAPDNYQFPPDGEAKILTVLSNDPFWADYDGPREITAASQTLLGSELEIAADGKSLVYTPLRDVYGKDAFVYIVDDLYPAEVQIEILNPLEPDEYREIVQRSENNLLDVLANDDFWPGYLGDRVITHVIEPTGGGTVAIAEGGKTVLYTPAPDFAGWDRFSYVVDGVYEASVSLQVHRPVQDDRFEVDTNTVDYPLIVTSNDVFHFWNGHSWITRDVIDRVTSVGETAHGGTVEITADGQGIRYSAPADFEGTDTFEYTADGKHRATVEVHVTRPVRDDYIASGVYEDTVDNVLDVLQNDFKGNGYQGPQIITSVSETSEEGIVRIAPDGRSLVYTPPTGYRGTDTFSYTVDGDLVAEAEVRIRSISMDDSYLLYPDPAEPQYTLYVLSNDHFGSNYPGPGLITAVGETVNGGLVTISEDGKFLRFAPAEGGSDGFTYTVDGQYESSVSVSFKNFLRADSFVVDQNSQENELDPLENDFRSSGSGGYLGPRKITSVGPSEHGATVAIAADGKTVVYWPAPDFIGTDRLTYTVDGLMQRTISVQVIRRVRDDVFRVEPDGHQNALPVLVNDLFGANYSGAGRVTAVTETGTGGTATVSEDGKSIVYTPAAGFTGEDKFTYTVDDALKAEVSVWVAASVEEILPQFESHEDFEQFLLDDALARYEHLFGMQVGPLYPGYPYDTWHFGGDTASAEADSSRSHSETNVQVAGVDEADIIETDGDYLYVLTGAELIIAKAWPAEEMSITSRVPIEGELVGEYLHGDRLTVISQTWEDPWSDPLEPLGFQLDVIDYWWPSPRSFETWVTVLDVSDRESPTIVEKTKLDGTYVESRRIEDSVFLVLRDDEVDRWLPEPERIQVGDSFFYETREQYIERVTAEMDSFLPQYTSYGADDELLEAGLLHASGDLFRPLGEDAGCLVTVVSLNVSDDEPGIVASTGIFTTGASQIYGSLDNLYVFEQQYTWEDGAVTEILKFDWDAEASGVAFAAKGWVPGHMLDQFSADELQGHLRIATSISNSYSGNWSGRSENVLFVLRDDGGVLEFVGSMQNLALGERIRSVRFMGERAFVTTFRDIDPLFALDLNDPAHPQARGHVTMPGFNSYMQLVNESYLLAVGRNTPVGNTGPTQVSLFDIQDLSRPRLIDQYTFERFSTSEAETDHHAFGWFAEHKVLAMPSARAYWERVDEDGDGYAETRRSVREDELLLFSIDVTATRLSGDGIQLLGELAHNSPVRRSAFIENVLYSVAEDSVQAVSIVDPTVRFAEIGFDNGPETPGAGGEESTQIRIIDDEDAGFRRDGNWGYHPDQGFADGMHYRRAGSGGDVASWTFWVEPGRYRVAATWPEYVSGASNAPFTVLDGSTPLATVRLDQDSAPDDFMEGQIGWESLGTFDITGNCLVVTLSDDADEYVIADAVRIEPVPTIAGYHVFYNNSTFDGEDPAPNDQDDLASADDKHPLLPGQTATLANYTTYSRGINGVMVDVAGLGGTLTPEDFELKVGNDNDPDGWELLTVTPSIDLRAGDGNNRSQRVTLVWEDNAIPTGNWLQVRVKATENTGLEQDEVFYFGNVIGDADGDRVATCADMYAVYQELGQPATVASPLDIDRDGVITQADMDAVFSEAGRLSVLNLITVPSVVATDDAATTDEDTITDIAVLGNDRDTDGNPMSVATADDTSALGASVTINLDGTLKYDPRDSATLQALAAGESVTDTFSYTVVDADGRSDSATVTIAVTGIDDPPTDVVQMRFNLTDPSGSPIDSVDVGELFELNVFVQDVRPDSVPDRGVYSAFLDVFYDAPLISTSGAITFGEKYSFFDDYVDHSPPGEIQDVGNVDSHFGMKGPLGPGEFFFFTVPFTADAAPIDAADDDPGTDAALNVGEDSQGVLVDVMANDTLGGPTELWGAQAEDPPTPLTDVFVFNDPHNAVLPEDIIYGSDTLEINSTGSLMITGVGPTSDGGTAAIASGGTRVQYIPPATSNALGVGETASDSFHYTVTDGFGTATATVTVTIVGENDAPGAQDAGFGTDEDAPINDSLAAHASDPDTNDSLTFSAGTSSTLGAAVTVNADGTFTYDPRDSAALQALAPGETMADTFSYAISDGNGGSDTATVTVTGSGVDEPQGGESIEAVALHSLADDPGPLATNLNTGGEDAAGTAEAAARDAVMAEAAEPRDPVKSFAKWDWLWWYDYEQMTLKKRSSKEDSLAQQAADELLAAWRA